MAAIRALEWGSAALWAVRISRYLSGHTPVSGLPFGALFAAVKQWSHYRAEGWMEFVRHHL
jgi:hypothetical protein